MAMALPCCAVSVPYYLGYDRFAVWPAPDYVSIYTIGSKMELYHKDNHDFR